MTLSVLDPRTGDLVTQLTMTDAGGCAEAVRRARAAAAHVGSSVTGRAIARMCAERGAKALLENGGNDALIVDSGGDVGWAAGQAAVGAFANAGQICVSVERVFVVETVAGPFFDALWPRPAGGPSGSGRWSTSGSVSTYTDM